MEAYPAQTLRSRLTRGVISCLAEASLSGGPCVALCGKCSPAALASVAALPLRKPFIPGRCERACATTDCDMGICGEWALLPGALPLLLSQLRLTRNWPAHGTDSQRHFYKDSFCTAALKDLSVICGWQSIPWLYSGANPNPKACSSPFLTNFVFQQLHKEDLVLVRRGRMLRGPQ